MTNANQPKPEAAAGAEEENTDEAGKQKKASGLDHVFKIAPADPKNNFDFEDVADK